MAVETFTSDWVQTDLDPDHVSIDSATKCSWTGMHRAEEARIYRDMGAGHFAGDFEHWLECYFDATSNYDHGTFWALANIVDDETACDVHSGGHLLCMFYNNSGTYELELRARSGGDNDDEDFYICSLDTLYYLKIIRTEDDGTYGHLNVYIYDDSGRTNLVDTIECVLGEKTDFRYAYAVQSDASSADTRTCTGYIQNLDFKEAAGGVDVTATLDELALTEYDATIIKPLSVTATLDELTLTEYDATIIKPLSVTAALDELALTEYNPVVDKALNVTAALDELALTEYAATVIKPFSVTAGLDELALTEYAATVTKSISVTAALDELALTEYSTTVIKPLSVTAGLDELALTTYNANVNKELSVTAGLDELALTEYNAGIIKPLSVTATLDELALTEYNASVAIGFNVSAGLDELALTEYGATIIKPLSVIATLAELALTEYNATVDIPSGVSMLLIANSLGGNMLGGNCNLM